MSHGRAPSESYGEAGWISVGDQRVNTMETMREFSYAKPRWRSDTYTIGRWCAGWKEVGRQRSSNK